jgi:hypothetical protein
MKDLKMKQIIVLLITAFIYSQSAFALRKGEKALLKVPTSLSKSIAQHVQKMYNDKYYDVIGPKDFFHGHLIPTHWQDREFTLPEVLSDSPHILYHTAEYNFRWNEEFKSGIPLEKLTPRSIVGFKDGHIQTAIDIIRLENLDDRRIVSYTNSGTLYDSDLIKFKPQLFNSSLELLNQHQLKYIKLNFKDGEYKIFIENQFYILPDEMGPYSFENSFRFDVFVSITDQMAPIGYSDSQVFGPILIPEKIEFPWPRNNLFY